MIYTRLEVTPSNVARRDVVSAALFAAGAEGLLEEGAAFVAVFADEADARVAQAAALRADAEGQSSCEPFDPGDWNDAWRRGVGAHAVGAFVIAPPWLAADATANTIVIDPAMGFGTGEHETTRLSLSLLQRVVRAGDRVADLGCGSGVLAIAAAKLGASRVAAIDNDPLAIGNAEENVARNGAETAVTVVEGDAFLMVPLLAPLRVIVANIIATVLIELLPVVASALSADGDVIVGGILGTERDDFVRGAEALGWRIVREESEGAWWGAHLVPGSRSAA